ncbi:MAG TPA: TonB-dependent receptor plug domain-containing protein, partial [Rudaea sp.]
MLDCRPMMFSKLCLGVRRGLAAALLLSSCAWAADTHPDAADAQQAASDKTAETTKTAPSADANKPSLMGEVKVVGYQTSSATSATGVVTAIIDTPISISAINNQFLNDVNASQAMQAIGALTGVTGQSNSGETLTNFAVRGYKITPQVDGFDSLAIVSGLGSTVGVDRIEVLKGPSAVFNGNVPPGGSINIIYKKPQLDANTTYFEGEFGSWSYRSGEFFSSGPITNKFAYLVDLYKKNSDGWVDWTGQDEKTAILGITFRPTDALSVNLNYRRIENDAQVSTLPVTHEGFIGSGLPQGTYLDAWVAAVYGPNEPPQTMTVPPQYLPGGNRYNVLGPQNNNTENLNFTSGEISYAVNDHVEIRDDFARA